MSISTINASLGDYQPPVQTALKELSNHQIIPRIWNRDHTVWKPEPTEISNRLGWLDIADRLRSEIPRMVELKNQLTSSGYTHALLLGMGGSSLAPEVISKTFKGEVTGLDLAILDCTHPGTVRRQANRLDLSKTVFIVATKSGGTVETLSFFKFFYNKVLAKIGPDQAGAHFIAITDPDSKLEALAKAHNFRAIFLNDPNIGGRFSVLSFFGLVPAALVGLDLEKFLDRSIAAARACGTDHPVEENPGAQLGAVLGALNQSGRDKVTFVASPAIASFGDWTEQLIAESTGKEGKGILPVVGEALETPGVYGNDRIFVHLQLGDDLSNLDSLKALAHAGHPVLHLQLADKYDLGSQFFLWEFATVVASHFLRINPYDQPNVESAKVLARKMVAEFHKTGKLPASEFDTLTAETLIDFLAKHTPGSYLSLQAYISPTPEAETALNAFRIKLRDKFHIATTLGFGPRFLHSTGQLHKGDAGRGLFIQISSGNSEDLPIPDQPGSDASSMGFQTLITSQALGDAAALDAAGRRLIRFQIDDIQSITQIL